jgi:hypothetical protein
MKIFAQSNFLVSNLSNSNTKQAYMHLEIFIFCYQMTQGRFKSVWSYIICSFLCSHREPAPGLLSCLSQVCCYSSLFTAHHLLTMDSLKVCKFQALLKMCKQDLSVLHTEMCFLREWVESMGSKEPPATHKAKLQGNIIEKKNSK